MHIRPLWFVFVIVFILLVIQCSGFLKSQKLLINIPIPQLIDGIRENAARIETFQGKGRFLAVSEETSMGGSIRVFARMPDSLWIKVEGPLGVDVATGWFCGNQAVWYVPMDGVVFSGTIERIRELDIVPVDVGSSNMIMGIVGFAIPEMDSQSSLYHLKIEDRKYLLHSENETIWINPDGPLVIRWEMAGFQDDLLWQWEGRNLKRNSSAYFPGTIRFTRWQPRERVTIFYEEIKINKSLRQSWFKIDIPKGVRKIEL